MVATKHPKHVRRWGQWLQTTPVRPGVYQRRDGGFLVRTRVVDEAGKRREKSRVVIGTLNQALHVLAELKVSGAEGAERLTSMPRFATFAAQLMGEKVMRGSLASQASRETWEGALRLYLIPAFGTQYIDEITRADVDAWLSRVAVWMRDGKPVPTRNGQGRLVERLRPLGARTANSWIRILKTICRAMVDRFDLPKDPTRGVKPFPEERAYTREKPNRVRTGDLPKLLEVARREYPNLYAMVVLGFLLGIRPSHMRPLRRKGPETDVRWDEAVLLIRRSSARDGIIMDKTKTGVDQEIALPAEMMAILQAHSDALPEGPARDSDFLFPAADGEMVNRLALTRPFAAFSKALGYQVTPRSMRRTFQNAARETGMHDAVTRSISGHATEEMQHHYSFAERSEQREGLAKILGGMLPKETA